MRSCAMSKQEGSLAAEFFVSGASVGVATACTNPIDGEPYPYPNEPPCPLAMSTASLLTSVHFSLSS